MTGVLDSGVGGLFVLKELLKLYPSHRFVYLADTLHFPYGEKSLSQLKTVVKKNIRFLAERGVSEVLVACNTASCTLEDKKTYLVPVKGIIKSSLQQAQSLSQNGKVGVLATEATVHSQVFVKKARALSGTLQIYQKPCPWLAPFVELSLGPVQKDVVNKEALVKKKLLKDVRVLLEKGTDTLILGCTHYLYFKSWLVSYFKKNRLSCRILPCFKKGLRGLSPVFDLKNPLVKTKTHRPFRSEIFFATPSDFKHKTFDMPGRLHVVVSKDLKPFKSKVHKLFSEERDLSHHGITNSYKT